MLLCFNMTDILQTIWVHCKFHLCLCLVLSGESWCQLHTGESSCARIHKTHGSHSYPTHIRCTAFHVISDPSSQHTSQQPKICSPPVTHLLQQLQASFKMKCHTYCSIYVFLSHLTRHIVLLFLLGPHRILKCANDNVSECWASTPFPS